MTESYLKNSVFVKTILMLLVILGHACAFWSGHWFTENPILQSQGLSVIYSWVGSFHIFAFALVSGYIFAFKISGGGYSQYAPFLQNKAKRLLIPYAFVALVWVAPISAYFFNWDFVYVVKKYLFAVDPSQLWFLWMLFDVFAIVWPMRNVMLKKPIMGWIIALALYGIGIVGKQMLPNIFCIWTACQYVSFFYIGMRIRVKQEKREKLISETVPWIIWLIVDLIVFAVEIYIGNQSGLIFRLIDTMIMFGLNVVGAIMAWSLLQVLACHVYWEKRKGFKLLSSYSMPMYLFHQQIIYCCIYLFNGKINPWLNATLNFSVAMICSFIISAILMRYKTTRFLIGEK